MVTRVQDKFLGLAVFENCSSKAGWAVVFMRMCRPRHVVPGARQDICPYKLWRDNFVLAAL